MKSAKFNPPARTRTSSCPALGTGSGTSRTSSTSGPPNRLMTMAFISRKVYQQSARGFDQFAYHLGDCDLRNLAGFPSGIYFHWNICRMPCLISGQILGTRFEAQRTERSFIAVSFIGSAYRSLAAIHSAVRRPVRNSTWSLSTWIPRRSIRGLNSGSSTTCYFCCCYLLPYSALRSRSQAGCGSWGTARHCDRHLRVAVAFGEPETSDRSRDRQRARNFRCLPVRPRDSQQYSSGAHSELPANYGYAFDGLRWTDRGRQQRRSAQSGGAGRRFRRREAIPEELQNSGYQRHY